MSFVWPTSLGKVLVAAALPVVLGACAHAPIHATRTTKVMMREINGHFKALRRQAADKQLAPFPEEHFTALMGLFEELKASPSSSFTADPVRWAHYCAEALGDVHSLETAWKLGDLAGVEQALQILMGTRDDAHNAFAGHPAHSRGK